MTCVFCYPVARVKKANDVLLAVRDGEARGVRENHRMHAKANARRLGNVFQQIHLLPVEADAINLIALAP